MLQTATDWIKLVVDGFCCSIYYRSPASDYLTAGHDYLTAGHDL